MKSIKKTLNTTSKFLAFFYVLGLLLDFMFPDTFGPTEPIIYMSIANYILSK